MSSSSSGRALTSTGSSTSLSGRRDSSAPLAAIFWCTDIILTLGLRSEERVRKGAEKLAKFLNAKQQGRLDGFFTAKPKASPKKSDKPAEKGKGKGTKRKVCSRVPLGRWLITYKGFVGGRQGQEGSCREQQEDEEKVDDSVRLSRCPRDFSVRLAVCFASCILAYAPVVYLTCCISSLVHNHPSSPRTQVQKSQVNQHCKP